MVNGVIFIYRVGLLSAIALRRYIILPNEVGNCNKLRIVRAIKEAVGSNFNKALFSEHNIWRYATKPRIPEARYSLVWSRF